MDLSPLLNHPASPIEELQHERLDRHGIRLLVKRDDRLQPGGEPAFCGNKVRKLKYNLIQAREAQQERLLTFGGAYSNHLTATAGAGHLFGFETVGIIRGEEHHPLNPSLRYARDCGMQLHYLDRSAYRQKEDPALIEKLRKQYGLFYLIPEGGTNALAVKGCTELADECRRQLKYAPPSHYSISCGTGGTLAGLIAGLKGTAQAIGFSALKGDFLSREVTRLLEQHSTQTFDNWTIQTDYHFGGYARYRPKLIEFIHSFYLNFGIPLDPIYTGKLFYGLFDLIDKGYFEKGATILAIHTGGLQGVKGFNERYGTELVAG